MYCYYHANAHDFAEYPTCADYDAAMAPRLQASVDLISVVSKPCPGCHIQVMKSGRFVLCVYCVCTAICIALLHKFVLYT